MISCKSVVQKLGYLAAFLAALCCSQQAAKAQSAFALNCSPNTGPVYVGFSWATTCTATGGSGRYTFTVTGLSNGLTSTIGTPNVMISGPATSAGAYNFSVTARDAGTAGVSPITRTFTGTINQAPTINCTAPNGTVTVGSLYNATCTESNGVAPITWVVPSNPISQLPAGLSATPNGASISISGAPTTAGSYSYQVNGYDANQILIGQQVFSGTITPVPSFTCQPSTGPNTNTTYSTTCTATGGAGTYNWSVTSGLPAGLTLGSRSGATTTISGTPTATTNTSYDYTLTVSDPSTGKIANQTFNGTITVPLAINCAQPANGPVFTGYQYSETCSAAGGSGTYSWSIYSSTLPDGLTLSSTSGATTTISGTPTTPISNYYYYLRLSDSAYSAAAYQSFSGTLYAAPTITSISPTNALVNADGFTLTVNGTNLGSNAVVLFNGNALTTTHYTTTNILTASVPASMLTAPGLYRLVINEGGTSATSSPATFTVAPILTSISPSSTGAGSDQFTLTVTGAGFLYRSGTSVQWNGVNLATPLNPISSTSLTATVPASLVANPGSAQVTVIAGGAVSSPLTFTIQAVPTLTAVSPNVITAGGSQFTLNASGTNFVSGALVRWNGANLTTSYVSATQLTAIVPASLIASAGTAQVSVSSNGFTTGNLPVTINAGTTITSISPTNAVAGGQSFTLTINGTNLNSNDGIASVTFGGTSLAILSASATQIQATVPANLIANAGNVTVAVAGPGNPTANFSVLPAPTLTSISPTSVTAGGTAFTLTATGTNFTAATIVQWNGQALTTTYVSATQLTGAVPATLIASAGAAQVTALLGGVSSAAQTFTISGAPTLTQINPSVVAAGGTQFVLTLTGTNFASGAVVRWNGQNLATVYNSATQLTATVPATLIATAGTAQVLVNYAGVNTASQTVTIYQIPTITLSPASAAAGSSGVTLTVTGSSAFLTPATVYWNATPLTTTVVSANVLSATVPATLLASAGTAQITVASSGLSTQPATFTINQPAATLTSINPNSATAGGTAFTLTAIGTNFTSGSVVQWNGQSLVTTFGSATSVTAAVPATLIASAGIAQVTVLTAGVSTAAQTFTIQAASTLVSISPNSATAGGASFNLTATGANFTASSVLRWNGQNLSTAFLSATQLTAAISNTLIAIAGTAQVSVVTGGVATANVPFTILPAPSITSLSPSNTSAGSTAFTLTVAGANFTSGTSVLWNGTALTSTFVSATQLTAAVPATLVASAGTAAVTVSQGNVISSPATFTITSAPTLSSLNPNTATVNSGQFTLTVNGTGFASGAAVLWNGAALTTAFVNATQLTAVVPASLLTTTGPFPITVTSGGVTTATSLPFTVVAAPTITSLNPNSTAVGGGPFLLTVNGSGFTSGSTIQWNGGSLTTSFVSATQLTTNVPASLISTVTTSQISVLTSNVASNSLPFVIAATPTLTSLTPLQAAAYGPAFTLTVNGTGFASGATILLNGNALTTTFVSTTQLTAAIPAEYITTVGNLPVRVTSAGIASSNSLTLQAVSQTLTQLSPSSASAGGPGFTLTVTGTGFGPTNTFVYWDDEIQLQTTVQSATQATAIVPANLIANAGTFDVTLVSANGNPTSPLTFTVNSGPTLSAISPNTATAGSADLPVTISGTGFGSDSVVGFGAINLATTFISSTQLTAIIPAAQLSTPGTFLVIVTTGGVHTTQLLFNVVAAPTLTSLSPNSVTAGAAGFPLTVNGTGFASTATVLWNNASLATTYVSATQLTATVPASLIAGAGTALVAVQSNSVTTGSLPVAINAPPNPVITISSLSPNSAVAGGSSFNLVITGSNVNAINSVAYFNGTLLTTLSSGSGNQLTVSVPAALIASAGTYSVQVSAPGYTTGSANFIVTAPTATLASLSPNSATAGTAAFPLTVNGTNFSPGAVALWNGAALTTTVVNTTQLTAAVPASLLTVPGTFPITVTSGGIAIAGSLPFNVLAAPTVTVLSPNTTAVGGTDFPLTVNGTGFTATSAIQWNGASLPTMFLSATQLRTSVPAAYISALTAAQVSVANGSTLSNSLPFAVVATPTLTSLSSNQVVAGSAAFTLTVNGSGFASGATVSWSDGETSTPLTTTFVSANQLTAAVPASYITNVGTFYIGVTSSGVASGNTLPFQVVSQLLTSLSPSSATAGGTAFTLTVNGAGFGSDATVFWGETSLATTFISSSKVTAAVTADLIAAAGTVQVSVASNDDESANTLPFAIAAGPSLSSLSPSSAIAGGADCTLTVNGTGFGSDAIVFWNGSALTTTVVSATQLTAAVPASLIASVGSSPITVTSGGVTTSSLPFAIVAAPTVTSLNPAGVIAGSPGFTLTVNGTGFDSAATVLWNNASLTTAFVSSTQLNAAVPAGLLAAASSAQVAVSSNGATTNSLTFAIAAPAITVTSLNPSSVVARGQAFNLIISGTNLNVSNAVVYFNNIPLTSIPTSNSATQYTLSVPATLIAVPGTYSVQVQAPGYTPGALSFTVLPAPAVTSLSPNTITAGSNGFVMTVNGTNFTTGTSVLWNGAALASTFNSAIQITANVPASLVANAGTANISASLGGVTSTPVGFNITNAPTLTSLSPASATVNTGAFTLTVNGTGFTSGATVLWNGAALTTAFVNATQLTAAVPASYLTTVNSFPVTVVSGGVPTATPQPFAVVAAPTVTSLSPNTTAVAGPAFPLTVNGTGFTSAAAIQWNGTGLTTTFLSATQLRTMVPAAYISALTTAQVSVANSSIASNALPFSVVPTPTLTSLSPPQTTVGSAAFTLTVNGSGFASGATVSWNDGESSTPLTTTFVSTLQLTAAVPASYLTSTGTFSISVTSAGIASGNTLDFQVVAQSLTSLSPNSATAGGTGFTLTVNGAGFGPDAAVVWGESSLPTTFVNSRQVTANVPASLIANPGTALVSVFSNDTQSSNSLQFTIVAGPTIASLTPNTVMAGSAGFALTVNGTGFGSDATVLWNGAALVTNVVSAIQLTALVPAGQIATAGTFPITVVSGGVATLTSLPFTVSTVPALTAINPNTATAGSPGFQITLTGTGFTSSTTVLWNNIGLPTTPVSATQITAAVPASLVAISSINQITAVAAGVSSNSLPFTVTPGAALLTSLSPSAGTTGGSAFTLTVNGSGFGSDATVFWYNTALTTTYVSANQVTANVPANLLTTIAAVPVTVVTGGVTSNNFLYFTITPGPSLSLTSISPNSAAMGGAAFTLTVNGAGFNSGATVLWNGAALTTTFVNATQLTAAVPASQLTTPGTFPITVVSGGVATSSSLPFTVSAAPALTSISPNSNIAGAGSFTLTANGSGFNSSATINWNGSPLTTTFVSATQLTAAVPAGLTVSAGISVVTVSQGGLPSNGLNFTTAAAPAFVSISPTSVAAGSAAFTLTVNGSGFAANASVLLNGAALPTTLVNATQLQATVPASLIVTPGPLLVTVISGNATLGPLTLTVIAGPAISALSPNAATAGGSAFTLTVTGTGFGPNATVQWNGSALVTTVVSAAQLTAAVPASLIASAGTASVTVTSGGVTSNSLTFTIAATQSVIAPVSLTGLPASAPAGSTQSVGVRLGNAAPVPLAGTLQLSFAPSVTGLPAGYIDPHVVFASGSTTSVNFTIPAGGTVASIPQGGAISLGTVAGTISVTLTSLTANGVNVLPSATVTSTVVVQATAPVIADGSVKITNVTTNGFTVQLTGYSTTREVSIAEFVFTAANGSQLLGSTDFTVPVAAPFATWFGSAQGQSYGSQFSLQVPFTVSGSTTSVVQSVSVTLRNSAGTSVAVSGSK